ncbi:WYL domain-containing transcriptional regulator [Oerskovia turbata]|uniref:WYL domain-containing transcriptional regulator n=1 Tax=Oerskovia turbata TaxID=1713 RepID=A0A4Q1KSB5_9CELL|nr:WYL domain-containing protein [Oerskovia turbata]RXR22425.1 WYL domain-containing transcriptional regulator [Oerskovia turbata]RXR32490.1 WYL domain-containing transcriptional regulator [Oerskovia turbata]
MLETSARLLALLSLLQARRDWPGEALAERLRVSPRTVRRDVDRLRELGYPVRATKGPDGGYRLDAGADLPPLLFDDEQAVAVAVALQTSPVGGLEEPAQRALATIRQVMPARLRGRIDALEVTVVRSSAQAARPDVDPAVLVAVGSAVRAREVLRFDYDGGSSALLGSGDAAFRPPRRAEPHHLVTWGGRWYLVAWDLERQDWRTFRVDRMTPRMPTGPRFAPRDLPEVPAARGAVARSRGDVAPGAQPAGGAAAGREGAAGRARRTRGQGTVPDVAAYVAHQLSRPRWPAEGEFVLHARADDLAPWVGDQGLVEALGPDRSRLVAGSWSWRGLAAWVGMFDVPFEVVGPAELRAAVREMGERYRGAVGDAGGGAGGGAGGDAGPTARG